LTKALAEYFQHSVLDTKPYSAANPNSSPSVPNDLFQAQRREIHRPKPLNRILAAGPSGLSMADSCFTMQRNGPRARTAPSFMPELDPPSSTNLLAKRRSETGTFFDLLQKPEASRMERSHLSKPTV